MSETQPNTEIPDVEEVVLTHTANSKTFRMLSQNRLRAVVSGLDGILYEDTGSEGFVLKHWNHVQNEWVHIVFDMDGEKAVVITQKHRHHNIAGDNRYRELGDFRSDQ